MKNLPYSLRLAAASLLVLTACAGASLDGVPHADSDAARTATATATLLIRPDIFS